MTGYWIGFALYLLFIVGGIYALKLPKLLGVRYFIFLLFIDLFYISVVYKNIIWQIVFGSLTLLVIFSNLSVNFIHSNKTKLVKRIELVIDFVIGIGLTVYLIYIIPNQKLQEILIPIISAVYGGLMTLVGVVLTIRKSDIDKKEEEIRKAKPVVFISDYRTTDFIRENPTLKPLFSEKKNGTLKPATKNDESYTISQILIRNSDYSYVAVRGFMINDDVHFYDFGQVLSKDSFMQLTSHFKFKYKKKIKYVSLILEDMLDNLYEMEVEFNIDGDTKDKTITILSGLKTERVDLDVNLKNVPND